MELTEKNGQASMEEILASIRRIIAEEPGRGEPVIDLDAPLRQIKGDGLLDDPSDFDLPSIFRAPSTPAHSERERPAPLFGRLSEALRAASTANGHGGETVRNGASLSSLRLQRIENAGATGEPNAAIAPAFALSTFHQSTGFQEAQQGAANAGPDVAPVKEQATTANGADMSQLPTRQTEEPPFAPEADGAEPSAENAGATPPAAAAPPEVPRQMAAFKDTRFRGMGVAPAPVEPVASWVSPFEGAATSALLEAADQPLLEVVEKEAPEASANGSYPAFEVPTQSHETLADVVPPPPPLPHSADEGAQPPVDKFSTAPIEDTTADLLRPMLRQWLADNMPRMVEKALHIEVAESVKTLKK